MTRPVGNTVRLELLAPAIVHWSADGWNTSHDTETVNVDIGVQSSRWENGDFTVVVRQLPAYTESEVQRC